MALALRVEMMGVGTAELETQSVWAIHEGTPVPGSPTDTTVVTKRSIDSRMIEQVIEIPRGDQKGHVGAVPVQMPAHHGRPQRATFSRGEGDRGFPNTEIVADPRKEIVDTTGFITTSNADSQRCEEGDDRLGFPLTWIPKRDVIDPSHRSRGKGRINIHGRPL